MKKILLTFATVAALLLALPGTSSACGGNCNCAHGKAAGTETAAKDVSLEGKVVSLPCALSKSKIGCTGAALAVGEDKHMIMKGGKGVALVKAAKGKDKTVKVEGRLADGQLTVQKYEIVKS